MGNKDSVGEALVIACTRTRGGRIKKIHWRNVILTLTQTAGNFHLETKLCSCGAKNWTHQFETNVITTAYHYICKSCGLVLAGSLRVDLSLPDYEARVADLLEHQGHDVLAAAIGASEIKQAITGIIVRWRRAHG